MFSICWGLYIAFIDHTAQYKVQASESVLFSQQSFSYNWIGREERKHLKRMSMHFYKNWKVCTFDYSLLILFVNKKKSR